MCNCRSVSFVFQGSDMKVYFEEMGVGSNVR